MSRVRTAVLRAVALAGASTGCQWASAYDFATVHPVTEMPESPPPDDDGCEALCTNAGRSTQLESCYLATLSPDIPRSGPRLECDVEEPSGSRYQRIVPVPARISVDSLPLGSDAPPELCQEECAHQRVRVLACRLDPFSLPSGPDEPFVVCNYHRKGHFYLPLPAGRAPATLTPEPEETPRSAGEYWARAARLEAASVVAFRILAAELSQLGAPSSLVERAHAAGEEEARHADDLEKLARSEGEPPWAPRYALRRERDIEAIATENAVEGCVRETLGAAVALHQAERATCARVREVMRRIAFEELGHAELAWSVHRYLRRRLDPDARNRVDLALAAAARERSGGVLIRDESAAHRLGLPTPTGIDALGDALRANLWLPIRSDPRAPRA